MVEDDNFMAIGKQKERGRAKEKDTAFKGTIR